MDKNLFKKMFVLNCRLGFPDPGGREGFFFIFQTGSLTN